MEEQTLPNLEGLTLDQKRAIETLHQSQKTRFFIGTSLEMKILEFEEVNKLRQTDPEKAEANEKALFAICGYDPSNN